MVHVPAWPSLARLREDQARYRWYALGVTTFTQAASSAVTSALGPLAPLLMAQFAISRGEVGLVQTAVYLSATWSALVATRDEVDLIELYSCFPSAVRVQQRELAIPLDRTPTVTWI